MNFSFDNVTSVNVTAKEEDLVTEFVFEVILLSVISFLGLLGNVGAIVLFATMKRQLKFHRLMMLLSGFDLIYVVLSFMLFALPRVSQSPKLVFMIIRTTRDSMFSCCQLLHPL